MTRQCVTGAICTREVYLFCTRRPFASTYIKPRSYTDREMLDVRLTSESLSAGGSTSFLGLRPGFGLAGMTHSFDAV